ncbi:MAG: amidohydrolase family protein, partial [Paracoccaceae bacterium]|nr:amidohydrolase family protein [Paracoccaceae bacterium]
MTSLWAETALLPGGWANRVRVDFEAGRILAVREGADPVGRRLGCLLPAPVNLHSHAFQRAMAGMTERRGAAQDSFWTWRALMYRFLDHLTPEDVQAIAAYVQVEMLEAGYSGVAEFHYLHHQPGGAPYAGLSEIADRIAAAAAESGIGLTLLPVLYQQGGCDGRALGAGQARFGNDPDRFARLCEGAGRAVAALPSDAVLGLAPHSLRAVSRDGLAQAVALAKGLGPHAPIHIHVAEQVAEV